MTEPPVAERAASVRHALLFQTTLALLAESAEPRKAADVVAAVRARVPFTDHEATLTASGKLRGDTAIRFDSSWARIGGWLLKGHDGWEITERGRAGLAEYPDAEPLYRAMLEDYEREFAERKAAQAQDAASAKQARLEAALELVEAGSWTTYGDLAEVAGLSAQTVGSFVAQTESPNGFRVLSANGKVSEGFRWADPDRRDDPTALLAEEGVEFDQEDRASQAQRLTAYELVQLLDGESGEVPRRAWLIRGGNVNGKNLIPDWLSLGWCSIAASQIRPLDLPLTRRQIAEIVETDYAQKSYNTRNEKVTEVDLFLNRVQPGDLVLTNDGARFYLGEITGAATSVASTDDRSNLRRPVTWLNPGSPVDLVDLPSGVKPLLSSQQPIVDLTSDVAALRALVVTDEPAQEAAKKVASPELRLAPATDELTARLLVSREWLQDCIDLLADRRQMIFYGPPGTGKTYLAQEIAAHLTDEPNVKLVQFHPSYSYEDFFEGYRPAPSPDGSGTVGFALVPGPFRRLVDAARENPATAYVLIIDEINRANLAKVFGELYFLLEYRDRSIDLLYSTGTEAGFTMPSNVFVIGTMNTADRSIALVDAAMRRRFAFKALHPSTEPTRSMLDKWLAAKGLPDTTARLLGRLNELIEDEDFKIGPSYFMRDSVHSDSGLRLMWETSILPLLEEHHFGEGIDVAKEYGLDRILKRATSGTDDEVAEPTGESDEGPDAPSEITNAG